MATKLEPDYPLSSTNNDSDGEEQEDSIEDQEDEEEEEAAAPQPSNVQSLLARLQSSGALIKKPVKQEYRCFTCEEDYSDWETLENHLIQHVSLPSIVLDKLPSDDEYAPSGDEWSDEDPASPPPKQEPQKTPQKIEISQLLKKTGLSIKKPGENTSNTNSESALSKLSGLGFTIKKNTTPIKEEKPDPSTNDVVQKLGSLGGIKLKLKSDGNANSFKVVNGLKDFKTSDDEESGNEDDSQEDSKDFDEDHDDQAQDQSGDEQEDEKSAANDKTGKQMTINSQVNLRNKKVINVTKIIPPKTEPVTTPSPVKVQLAKPVRPAVKQTPKRGANLPLSATSAPTQGKDIPTTPERRDSNASQTSTENVVVKREIEDASATQAEGTPLFSGQIKSERASPPPANAAQPESTPVIARIKSDPDEASTALSPSTAFSRAETPLLAVTKKEDTGVTVIEINGDSGDDDDDCCVVSATPAPDVKPPLIPKTEPALPTSYPPPSYHTSQSSYSSTPVLASNLTSSIPGGASTEKQHSFNWNAPDSKPAIDMLEKSADEIFESLLSSSTKKEHSLSDASEYISLDTLGPQHSCDVCNTRFTNISLLDDHIRMTGHTKSIVTPTSSLLPYNPSGTNSILSSLLPVKCLADQVGKLSGMNSGPGFTHQQNVMINIQAYPGAGGVMVPPQSGYNAYPPGQNAYPPGFQQMPGNGMFGNAAGPMPGQYPGQHYSGGYGPQQSSMGYQPPMSKPCFSPGMQQNSYTTPSSPYSTASPLQNMQQAYGQNAPGMMNPPMGQMGPPGSSPSHPYPASSPGGSMKPPTSTSSGIRIQNVQTFPPGQLAPGSSPNTQMPAPGQIRMAAGANVTGARPRMPLRGARPSIRPGIQVHGQVRGGKVGGPRMPMKRPANMAGGPGQKRRPDMLLPGKHDNEDCQVMAMQKQREGLPMISSVQGAKDKLNLGSQISITKKTVNKEANAMANVLASRGISIKQKQKSRSPTPERPIPHIPNLGSGVSIKHTSKSSNFSIPEAKVGSNMHTCGICRKMFSNSTSLSTHMAAAHPQRGFKCDECPASYPKSLQLQHHKRVFHNVTGPSRELGLPVVDLSQEENLQRLSSLGIYSFIPLANREQAGGCFGIPVISVHNMNNGMTSSLQALGADGLLSLGPLKPLPNT